METTSNNITCTALTDVLTTLAKNTSPDKKQTSSSSTGVETITRKQQASYLADTAEAVREVAKKMSRYMDT